MVYATDFVGNTDNDIIDKAIANKDEDGIVVIGAKKDGRLWALDRAILLPSDTTVIIRNCKLKLTDSARDNFFRTANCGIGIEDVSLTKNIHIIGEGYALLEGADRPRATGDSSKTLANPCPYLDEDLCKYAYWVDEDRRTPEKLTFGDKHAFSFGTDCDKEGEVKHGDWRGIGILFANVDGFSIENIKIKDSHGWCISVEAGTNGVIRNIEFDCHMHKGVDGMESNFENQDGIDLRNGCNNILISDITGTTGDDVVALTAISANRNTHKSGSLESTHVLHDDWSRRDSTIHDVIIRNVKATSNLCWLVRLLAVETKIYNVIVDNVIDTAESPCHFGTVLLGEADFAYGVNRPDSIDNIVVSNVISNASLHAIGIRGCVSNSVINNVINKNPECKTLEVRNENALKNVTCSNIVTSENK